MVSKLLSANEDVNNPNNHQVFQDSEELGCEEGMRSRMLSLNEDATKSEDPDWEDRVSMWHDQDAGNAEDNPGADIDLSLDTHDTGIVQEDEAGLNSDVSPLDAKEDHSEDDHEDYVISQFTEAWNFVVEGEAYQWLLGKIKAQLVLDEGGTVMETIRTKILQALSFTKSGNTYRQAVYKATFEVAWCPATFIQDQFPDEQDIRLGAILVLTGSRLDAQATTCAQYMHQTWPTTGAELLLALEYMVANEFTKLYRMYNDHTFFNIVAKLICVRTVARWHSASDCHDQLRSHSCCFWICTSHIRGGTTTRVAWRCPASITTGKHDEILYSTD